MNICDMTNNKVNTVLIPMNADDFISWVVTAVREAVKTEFESRSFDSAEGLKPFLSRKEAAELLGVSLPTLNDWSKSGVVPSYKLGSRVRYRLSDIQTALRKQHSKLSA